VIFGIKSALSCKINSIVKAVKILNYRYLFIDNYLSGENYNIQSQKYFHPYINPVLIAGNELRLVKFALNNIL